MKPQILKVDVDNEIVFASTEWGVDLVSLMEAGNIHRLKKGMPVRQLNKFLSSKYLEEYIEAATRIWELPKEAFLCTIGKGKGVRHYGHISIAVLLAEQISPEFHVKVHKTFIEGKLLEFRVLGGDEFKMLNAAIAEHLPSPSGDNKGRYIQLAIMIRDKCKLLSDSGSVTWNQAVADAHAQRTRYELEAKLCQLINLGLVRDWEHLKEIIAKIKS
jgi:hypothetical protein